MLMIFLFAELLLPSPLVAQQSPAVLPVVLINEIAWMGTQVAHVEQKNWWRYEWMELYNPSDVSVGLDGWVIELSRDKPDFTISLKGSINPKGYFLIGASDRIPNVDVNYRHLGGKFVNSGGKVLLKNSAGEIIDELDARAGWPAGDNESKRTMERAQGSESCRDQGSEPCRGVAWQTSAKGGGTPKAQNSSGLLAQKRPVIRRGGESDDSPKKDLRGSSRPEGRSGPSAAFLIGFPGAVLASALALAARRFLVKRV